MGIEKKLKDISSKKLHGSRSFWKKVDYESWLYFLYLTFYLLIFMAAISYVVLIMLNKELEGGVLLQVLIGIVILVLYLLEIIRYIFSEIERVSDSI